MSARGQTRSRWRWEHWFLVILLVLAWLLRLPPALDSRLHPDEALYGYWGLLVGWGRDPWLVSVPVYKPPLLPYLLAGVQGLFGRSELSLRLPGLIAGLLMVPLVASLSRALYRSRESALLAAGVAALSPFGILFSATAFPDLPMVVLGLAGVVAAARGRSGWAGLLVGLSFAMKQTGVLWLPVALWAGQIRPSHDRRHWLRSALAFLLMIALVFAWDAVRRSRGATSFWSAGVSGYGGLRMIWPQELWPRLRDWVGLARYLFVSPVLGVLGLITLPALAWSGLARRGSLHEKLADLVLVSFCLVYLLLHWLWAFPVWDRYLLPLVPVLSLSLARVMQLACSSIRIAVIRPSLVPLALVGLLLAAPAVEASRGHYPIGGDHGMYDGIDKVAAYLRHLPEGAVVYQHWLGWHFAFYLFDAALYQAFWPTPTWLARDVEAFGAREPRYIVFPSWESSARVAQALSHVGYGLRPELMTQRRDESASFTVYRIAPSEGS